MFDQYVSKQGKPELKHKVKKSNGSFYYITYSNNIFYLVFAENEFSENAIFNMIDFIHRQGISTMTERGKGLTKLAKDNFKNIMKDIVNKTESLNSTAENSNNNSRISQVQGEIDSVQLNMKDNIKKILVNLDDVNSINEKSATIRDGSLMYRNLAADYRNKTWWNSKIFKFGIIAICLILVTIIIFWAFS